MNQFENLDAQNDMHRLAQIDPCEQDDKHDPWASGITDSELDTMLGLKLKD